jgi:hypothetical protein
MNRIVLIVVLAIVVTSCKKEEKAIVATDTVVVKDKYADLYGNWVGDFVVSEADSTVLETEYMASNKINIVIKKIENGNVYGQSIVAGNLRQLVGTIVDNADEFVINLNEPGERKDDGEFEFTIQNDTLDGIWYVNNRKFPVWERKYKLTKQPFKYNPKLMLPEKDNYIDYFSMKSDSTKYANDDGTEETYYEDTYRMASGIIAKLNASTTLLKESDVKNLKRLELEIIRNTIFARHGYTFKKKSFRQFFDPVDWYIPVTDNMSGKLTLTEQQNIILLNRFQKYAEDNYDSFGR